MKYIKQNTYILPVVFTGAGKKAVVYEWAIKQEKEDYRRRFCKDYYNNLINKCYYNYIQSLTAEIKRGRLAGVKIKDNRIIAQGANNARGLQEKIKKGLMLRDSYK